MAVLRRPVPAAGPILPVELTRWPKFAHAYAHKGGGRITRSALIDTGASHTFIPRSVVDELALEPHGEANISHLGGTIPCLQFAVHFILPEVSNGFDQVVLASPNPQLAECLIGRDFLNKNRIEFRYLGVSQELELHIP